MCVHFQIFENSNRFPRNGYMPSGRSRLGVPNWFKLRGICVYAPKTVRFGPFWTKPSIPAFRAAPWLSIDTPNKTITQNLTVLWPLRKSTLVFWKRLVVRNMVNDQCSIAQSTDGIRSPMIAHFDALCTPNTTVEGNGIIP